MELLLHAGNVLYVLSYSVRDILRLRGLTILGLVALLAYYGTSDPPLYAAIGWSVLFLGINGWQTWRLILERRPVQLTADERRLHRLAFSTLDEREFKRLVVLGSWETLEPGTTFVEQGAKLEHIRVMVEGSAQVEVDEAVVGEIGPGQLIGEMSYLTRQTPTATVIAKTDVRMLCLSHADLEVLLEQREALRAALQRIISTDLCSKLSMVRDNAATEDAMPMSAQPSPA